MNIPEQIKIIAEKLMSGESLAVMCPENLGIGAIFAELQKIGLNPVIKSQQKMGTAVVYTFQQYQK